MNDSMNNLTTEVKWTNFSKKKKKPENLNDFIIIKDIEYVILKFPQNKSPGSGDCIGKFYQMFKKELTPIYITFFRKKDISQFILWS